MANKKKAAKATKKGRTRIKNLPVGEKQLSAAQKKKVKGGLIAVTMTTPVAVATLTSPLDKGATTIVLDSELGLKKFLGGV